MLIGAESPPFDSPDYLYELKLDGARCLAYVGNGKTELINKRQINVTCIYPELSQMHAVVRGCAILDGEIIVMNNGRPDFSELRRRALISNPLKIRLLADTLPVSFTAFDILYADGKDLTAHPLTERKNILRSLISEGNRLSVSRVVEVKGTALFDLTKKNNLEGIVAKRKSSIYSPGKRTKDWIKSKNLLDDDYVICGYIPKSSNITSLIIAQYRGNHLIPKGHVTLGVSTRDFRIIDALPKAAPHFPEDSGDVVWVEPRLVGTVKFMEKNPSGSLRQPVFKGLRDDKKPEACIE